MMLETAVSFLRTFTSGSLDDGSRPALAPDRPLACPLCGSSEIERNGRFCQCLDCYEFAPVFDFEEMGANSEEVDNG